MNQPSGWGATGLGSGALVGLTAFVLALALPGDPVTDATVPWPHGPVGENCATMSESARFTGVSLVPPSSPMGAEIMAPLARVNAGWVGLLPYAFLDGEGNVNFDGERQWWGERSDGVETTVAFAREHGLKVMVKPHLWARGGLWVGDYLPGSEAEWLRWELAYSTYILNFARLGEALGVELFVVGTELDSTVEPREAYWRNLIHEVRQVYSGEVTYSANWDGFHQVPFWDALDYVGVNAYFPLSQAANPSVEALQRAWAPRVRELEELCERYGIPVFFPEYGYRSIDGAAGNQWELPPERFRNTPLNLDAQVAAYEAMFRSVWSEPWFAGGFLWKWFPDDASRGQILRADYTPQHKPVEEVIRAWYGEPQARPQPGPTVPGVPIHPAARRVLTAPAANLTTH